MATKRVVARPVVRADVWADRRWRIVLGGRLGDSGRHQRQALPALSWCPWFERPVRPGFPAVVSSCGCSTPTFAWSGSAFTRPRRSRPSSLVTCGSEALAVSSARQATRSIGRDPYVAYAPVRAPLCGLSGSVQPHPSVSTCSRRSSSRSDASARPHGSSCGCAAAPWSRWRTRWWLFAFPSRHRPWPCRGRRARARVAGRRRRSVALGPPAERGPQGPYASIAESLTS